MRKNEENVRMTKRVKRIAAAGIAMGLMTSLVLSGCTKKDDSATGQTSTLDPNGESYVADFYSVTDENDNKAYINKVYLDNGKIYAVASIENNGKSKNLLAVLNTENMQEEGRLDFQSEVENLALSDSEIPDNIADYKSGVFVNGVLFTEEGIDIHAEWYAYDYSNVDPDDMGYSEIDEDSEAAYEDVDSFTKEYIVKFDKNYNFQGIEEVVYDFMPDGEYVQNITSDGQGHIAFIGSHVIVFTDTERNVLQSVKVTENWINSYFIGENGDIYVIYYDDNWDMNCGKVSANSNTVAEGVDVKDTYASNFFFAENDGNILYYYDSNKLYRRDLGTGETTEILKWLDIDVDGSSVNGLYEENGIFYGNVMDYSTYESELIKIYQVSNAEITVKTEIRLASLYSYDATMEAAIVAYNKSQDKYKIVSETYYDWQNDGDSLDDALVNLNNDITGSSAPDIICLEGLDVRGLVNKGAFEDLNGFIASSSNVNIADYNKTVINAYTFDGKLISLPRSFNLMTMIVNADGFPEGMDGWTLSEMLDYINAHPGCELEPYLLRDDFIESYIGYNLSEYIDWNTGKVDFNKESFRKALEYAATLPAEIDWSNVDYNYNFSEELAAGRVLAMRTYLSQTEDIQMYNAYFKTGAKYIGMPNPSGVNTQIMTTGTGYAISATSAYKEAAWDFMEFYLGRERSTWDYALPSNNNDLQAMFDKELEHAGELNGSMMSDDTGWEYEFHYSTQEEIDQINALIDAAVAIDVDSEIMSIIEEEASGYLSGQKSLDEVITLIQSRVQIYVSERM